jgi:hypothetical protein
MDFPVKTLTGRGGNWIHRIDHRKNKNSSSSFLKIPNFKIELLNELVVEIDLHRIFSFRISFDNTPNVFHPTLVRCDEFGCD